MAISVQYIIKEKKLVNFLDLNLKLFNLKETERLIKIYNNDYKNAAFYSDFQKTYLDFSDYWQGLEQWILDDLKIRWKITLHIIFFFILPEYLLPTKYFILYFFDFTHTGSSSLKNLPVSFDLRLFWILKLSFKKVFSSHQRHNFYQALYFFVKETEEKRQKFLKA